MLLECFWPRLAQYWPPSPSSEHSTSAQDNQWCQTRAGKRTLYPNGTAYNINCVFMIVSLDNYLCVVVLVAAGLGNVITGPAPTNLNWLLIHKYMDTQSPTLGVKRLLSNKFSGIFGFHPIISNNFFILNYHHYNFIAYFIANYENFLLNVCQIQSYWKL